ncbi:hypothetical protein AHF37_10951 [Paragonimus kellicotti]|nr:hypothetical protein AHF37_10951 [Paragonimus kellicotti]
MSEERDTASMVKPTDFKHVESTASSLVNMSRSRQLTNAERAALLDSTRILIEMRLLENCIYERYLARMKPEFLYLIARLFSLFDFFLIRLNVSSYLAAISFMSAGLRKKSIRRSVAPDRLTRLTAEQRCIVAQSELEEYKKDIERLELEGRMTLDQEKMTLEAANMRAEEIQKSRAMFDKYVTSILDSPKERTELENRDFDVILRFHRAYLRRMMTLEAANMRAEEIQKSRAMFDKYVTSILDSPKERTELENRDFDVILRFHRAYLRRMPGLDDVTCFLYPTHNNDEEVEHSVVFIRQM